MVKIGDRFILPKKLNDITDRSDFEECTVVYVHPKHRFCEVEFGGVNGKFRMSFKLNQNGEILLDGTKVSRKYYKDLRGKGEVE